jgi:hypothetical protein
MAAEENDNEPVKVTEKLRSEITEEVPLAYQVLEPSLELEEEEERFEETITKAEEWKPKRQEKAMKRKRKRPDSIQPNSRSVSKLHNELRKHADARKKTELAVKDIEKQLKDLLLVHHSAIKDLQKQVTQMYRKIATIDSSTKSTRVKTTGKKTMSKGKKTRKKTTGKKKSTKQ